MIFVTGGTGMLGARLLLDLTGRGEKVRALKRNSSDTAFVRKFFSWYTTDFESLLARIEWIDGDLLDPDSIRPALAGVDKIFHCAAMVSFDRHDHEKMLINNIEGTIHLTELALEAGVARFCHVSSIAALGSAAPGIAVNESHAWQNDRTRSAYSESKFQSEMEVWRAIYQGLNAVIVNPSIILGPGKWNSGSPQLFSSVQKGMKFFTQGGTGFVDVADVSAAIIGLMFHPEWETLKNSRYLLNAENLAFADLFGRIADRLDKPRPSIATGKFLLGAAWRLAALVSRFTGKKPAITRETARSAAKLSFFDGSKITEAIGFRYTPIDETLDSIAAIFRKEHLPQR